MAEVYKRLIKNCIICWNYLYLSQKLAEIDDPAKWEELLQAMALGSAAAWGHLNLLGEYDFSEDKLQDSGRNQAPKTDRLNQVPSWEFRNRRKSFTPRQLARILWDFAYLCWANTIFDGDLVHHVRLVRVVLLWLRHPVQVLRPFLRIFRLRLPEKHIGS
jgi:hypothetical protein